MNKGSPINTTAYRRRASDASVREITSSVANLIEATQSRENLSGETKYGSIQYEISKKPKKCAAFKGFLYTFCCSLFITLSSVIVKKLTYISPGELSMIRNIGVLLGNIPILVYSEQNPLGPRSHRILLLIRSFLGATALYLNLIAYRLLPLAEAAIIMSTLPAVVSIMAKLVLKEPCGVTQTIAVIFTITGVLLSIRLPEMIYSKNFKSVFTRNDITGIVSAVGCVLLLSLTFIALRKMKDVHFSVIMVYLGFIGAVENAGITATISHFSWPRCGLDVAWVLMVAIFGFVGNSCLTLAIQAEAVSIVSVLKASLDIILAMILQIIFFGSIPDVYNISGAVLVFLSVTITGLRKWLLGKSEDSLVRKRLRILLF